MRAVERAYMRLVIDPAYAAAVASDADADGLTTDEVAELMALPHDVIAVERRGRHAHLWDRARAHMPRTTARAERCLSAERFQSLRHRLFSCHLWDAEAGFDLPPFGKGHEMATPLRGATLSIAAESEGEGDDEAAALAALACVERELFGFAHRVAEHDAADGMASFDLHALLDGSLAPAESLRLPTPMRWRVGRRRKAAADA